MNMNMNIKSVLLCTLIFLSSAVVQLLAMELSFCHYTEWVNIDPIHLAIGYLTVLTLTMAFLFICNRPWLALLGSAIFTTLVALANFYILETRGTPFTFMQLENVSTALNVVSSYRFEITTIVEQILISGGLLFVLCFLLRKVKADRIASGIILIVLCVMMRHAYGTIVPANVVGWSWDASVSKYGYTTCLTQCTFQSTISVVKPATYNEQELRNYVASFETDDTRTTTTPDIIFILNESWYDLNQVTDVQASKDTFAYIHSLKNSLQGNCIVPCAGGGTNVSEYEYLTGNSIYLSPNSNPFNTIDIMNGNSFATHLESLGYNSLATHTEFGVNYSRDVAFPALGFDTVYFREEYTDPEYYGGRLYYPTDTWAYRHLIQWYEEMGDAPRVMYLLTVQNHGGYEFLNEAEYLVRTKNDYGEYTNQVNEFLTCTSLTDKGFKALVNYFKNVDRDVVICMVGDHAPAFASNIATIENITIPMRSVPYVIWSNHIDLQNQTAEEQISLHYMPSYVMDVANVEMSVYYETTNALRKNVPVMTSYGQCIDSEGNAFQITEENQYKEMLDLYLNLAYANMKKVNFMMN